MTIATRLAIAFTAVIVLTGVVGAMALRSVSDLDAQTQRVAQLDRAHGLADDLRFLIADASGWQVAYVLDAQLHGIAAGTDPESDNRVGIADDGVAVADTIAKLRATDLTDEEKVQVDELEKSWAEWFDIDDNAVSVMRSKGIPAAIAVVNGPGTDSFTKVSDQTSALIESLSARVDAAAAAATSTRESSTRLIVIALVLIVAAGATSALLVRRSIAAPLSSTVEVLRRFAAGDLTVRAERDGSDELTLISEAVTQATTGVSATVEVIVEVSRQLSAAAEELQGLSERIASSTGEVAGASQRTALVADQVSAAVTAVAGASEQMQAAIGEVAASSAAAVATGEAATGRVAQAQTTVDQLSGAAEAIDAVRELIASVSAQTRLLALNATIEAARAGDAGRGFAVVAGEVKNLADQTSDSSSDIAKQVAAIQDDVDATGRALADVVATIEQIVMQQAMIAAAVEEQTVTTGDIARSLAEAVHGTGEIAAGASLVAGSSSVLATDSAVAADKASELAAIAQRLRAAVAVFTTESR